jgi:hypothetical protein
MNNFDEEAYLTKLYDELNSSHSYLMNEFKNDKEMTKEKVLTAKLNSIETMRRCVLKYRNIRIKEKLTGLNI